MTYTLMACSTLYSGKSSMHTRHVIYTTRYTRQNTQENSLGETPGGWWGSHTKFVRFYHSPWPEGSCGEGGDAVSSASSLGSGHGGGGGGDDRQSDRSGDGVSCALSLRCSPSSYPPLSHPPPASRSPCPLRQSG